MAFTLELLPETFAICRLAPGAPFPDWAQGEFVSITRTPDNLTVVCRQCDVPKGVHNESGWRSFRLVGQFDLTEVGVMASLTQPLAEANISVFAIGTFDTDYLLVRESNLDLAVAALENSGHAVRQQRDDAG